MMKSLSSVGVGLSIVFGCLLLALIAELYYLLWWKKRLSNRDIENYDDYSNPARDLFYMFCLKQPSSLRNSTTNIHQAPRITENNSFVQDSAASGHNNNNSNNKEFLVKGFGDQEGVEAELMRLHSLSGPPRFLFTIIEETKEDLESEDGKSRCDEKSKKGSRGSKSLSDVVVNVETPYLTPLASPTLFITPPLTPLNHTTSCGFSHQGFNPLFESSTDAEFNKIKQSPPPKFKFLQDAEEKLYRRTTFMEEEIEKLRHLRSCDDGFLQKSPNHSKFLKEDEEGESFITLIVDRNKEKGFSHHYHQQEDEELSHNSSTSQVLLLGSSPSTFQQDFHD